MVRLTLMLFRVPVIKFRKGGLGRSASASRAQTPGEAPGSSPPGSSSASCILSRSQPAASMSTCSIPDIELPAKYKRAPLSEEEIDKINGGGIA